MKRSSRKDKAAIYWYHCGSIPEGRVFHAIWVPGEPKPPWRERKEQYLAHLSSASSDALLVSIADKLHNARSVLADYRRHKENLWMRFTVGKEEQFWYYGELVRVFTQRRPEDPLVTEFARVVKELKDLDRAG